MIQYEQKRHVRIDISRYGMFEEHCSWFTLTLSRSSLGIDFGSCNMTGSHNLVYVNGFKDVFTILNTPKIHSELMRATLPDISALFISGVMHRKWVWSSASQFAGYTQPVHLVDQLWCTTSSILLHVENNIQIDAPDQTIIIASISDDLSTLINNFAWGDCKFVGESSSVCDDVKSTLVRKLRVVKVVVTCAKDARTTFPSQA